MSDATPKYNSQRNPTPPPARSQYAAPNRELQQMKTEKDKLEAQLRRAEHANSVQEDKLKQALNSLSQMEQDKARALREKHQLADDGKKHSRLEDRIRQLTDENANLVHQKNDLKEKMLSQDEQLRVLKSNAAQSINEWQESHKDARKEIDDLNGVLSKKDQESTSVRNELQAARDTIRNKDAELYSASDEIQRRDSEIEKRNTEIQSLRSKMDQQDLRVRQQDDELAQWQEKYTRISEAVSASTGAIVDKDKTIVELKANLLRAESETKLLKDTLGRSDASSATLHEQIKDLREKSRTQHLELMEREGDIAQRDKSITELNMRITSLESELVDSRDAMQRQDRELNRAKTTVASAQSSTSELEETITGLRNELAIAEKANEAQAAAARSEHAAKDARIDEVLNQLNTVIASCNGRDDSITQLQQQLQTEVHKREEAIARATAAEEQVETKQSQISGMEEEFQAAAAKYTELSGAFETAKTKIVSLESQVALASSTDAQLRGEKGAVEQTVASKQAAIDELTAERNALSEQLNAATSRGASLEAQLASCNSEIEQLRTKQQSLSSNIDSANNDTAKLSAELSATKAELEKQRADSWANLQSNSDALEAKEAELAAMKKRCDELQNAINSEMSARSEDVAKSSQATTELQTTIAALSEQLETAKAELSNANTESLEAAKKMQEGHEANVTAVHEKLSRMNDEMATQREAYDKAVAERDRYRADVDSLEADVRGAAAREAMEGSEKERRIAALEQQLSATKNRAADEIAEVHRSVETHIRRIQIHADEAEAATAAKEKKLVASEAAVASTKKELAKYKEAYTALKAKVEELSALRDAEMDDAREKMALAAEKLEEWQGAFQTLREYYDDLVEMVRKKRGASVVRELPSDVMRFSTYTAADARDSVASNVLGARPTNTNNDALTAKRKRLEL